MKIIVKGNNPMKAYKLLNKKLKDEGLYKELKKRKFARSKSEAKRYKHENALIEHKKREKLLEIIRERKEQKIIINAKRKSKKAKQNYNKQNR